VLLDHDVARGVETQPRPLPQRVARRAIQSRGRGGIPNRAAVLGDVKWRASAPVERPLTYAYNICIYMHMRTTLILDDALVERARRLTGISEKTALVHAGLEALVSRESARRLAALGGTMPDLAPIPRRRATRRR